MSSPRGVGGPATRSDVAELAGVSVATVTYVINSDVRGHTGRSQFSAATGERVRAAIDELGYRPNRNAQALKTGKSHLLGLVLPGIENPYYAEYALEFESAAAELGYALLIMNSHPSADDELSRIEDLRDRSVDAIVVASTLHAGSRPEVSGHDAPVVWIDAFDAEPGAASVGPAAHEGLRLLVDHLVGVHGYSRIALVLGANQRPGPDPREVGWAAALTGAGVAAGRVVHTQWTREGGVAAGLELFSSGDMPHAVIAASDLIGFGLLRAADTLGLRVPDDVAVVSFDGTEGSAYTHPPLTVFEQPIRAMAQTALTAALSEGRSPIHQEVPGSLIIRSSCGC